ncbi:beta-ketoacyl synthase [Trinickia acidisoli]|uniref:beta-ketoacyl synthase n=1 Tax=Trinickia acidisoli TaxID=2767482 RepID=UPI001A8D3749|nr:beta-ketoacyl synthase [Trinickia acidisoli]
MNPAPVIAAAACTFPSGPTLELADAAVRAQLSLLQRHPEYIDQAGQHCRGSFFPIDAPFNAARWALLAKAALEQLTVSVEQALSSVVWRRPCVLWLVLPDADRRPGLPHDLVDTVMQSVQDEPFRWDRIVPYSGGHAAGLAALREASDYLSIQPEALAVVLGVESGLGREAMLWLDMQSLLHGARHGHQSRPQPESYGRIPGEGAAAVALTGRVPRGFGMARLLGASVAEEPITHASDGVCTGAGLTRAARTALEQAQGYGEGQVCSIITDLNGEPYRADQFGFTALRLSSFLAPQWQRSLPALASGDLNSASSVAHVALAAYTARKQPATARQLVLASSDDPLRGAVVIGAPDLVHNLQETRL